MTANDLMRVYQREAEKQRLLAGGEGGIRTPDTVARMPHFECGAFNHSATSPGSAWAAPEARALS